MRRATKQHRRDEISPWVGLAFGALYLAAILGVAAVGISYQHRSLDKQRVDEASKWTWWLARHVAQLHDAPPEVLALELQQAAREPGVAYCAVVSADGMVTAHSDSTRIGEQIVDISFDDSPDVRVQVGTSPERAGEQVLVAQMVPTDTATPAGSRLHVGLEPFSMVWTDSDIAFGAGYVLLAVLGLFLIIYRVLRRSIKPLAVIRSRLEDCGGNIEDRLSALRLNDSYDQVATSWNQLIELVSNLKQQVSESHFGNDISAAMDGYRSQRLTELLMRIPFGVMVLDEQRAVGFANRAACGMLGAGSDELEGRPAVEVMGDELLQKILTAATSKRRMSKGSSRHLDHEFERGSATTTLRFWSGAGEGGETVVFLQDISQFKEAERAQDNFLYHVTHELRTPLTNIRAYAETLSQGVIDDEQTIRECYNVIMGETSRLSRLVEDLLNVSQLEVGTARIQKTDVNIAEVVRKVVQDNQGSADSRRIELVLHLPAKMPKVSGDRDRLTVVFNNLVGNAIKYTPEGGRVEIQGDVDMQRVEISVADSGIGIDAEDQEKVFKKFYRVEDERVTAVAGTGLGLAIARETMQAHGGTLGLESKLGEGSTFTAVLPAVPLDGDAGPIVSASQKENK